jgi:protein-tyrosine phosphatase
MSACGCIGQNTNFLKVLTVLHPLPQRQLNKVFTRSFDRIFRLLDKPNKPRRQYNIMRSVLHLQIADSIPLDLLHPLRKLFDFIIESLRSSCLQKERNLRSKWVA